MGRVREFSRAPDVMRINAVHLGCIVEEMELIILLECDASNDRFQLENILGQIIECIVAAGGQRSVGVEVNEEDGTLW